MSLITKEAIAKIFIDYLKAKNFHFNVTEEKLKLRIELSNLKERAIVDIYNTGAIVVQGKQTNLKSEMDNIKEDIEHNPDKFLVPKISDVKPCATRYDIMLPQLRMQIKELFNVSEGEVNISDNPTQDIEYRAKITKDGYSVTITQYRNGTLLLQGKSDPLFHGFCDQIEEIAKPSDKEVIARFISSDQHSLDLFVAKYTPQLIEIAEHKSRELIGEDVYNYLELHDRKWLIASMCLCLLKIPLPEYSPLVMPASKAFEGFVKKLLVDIGLFPKDHFRQKIATFSALNDPKDPNRISICSKEMHADTVLRNIDICLKTYRHFVMHSDNSQITKIDTYEEAQTKFNRILEDIKSFFNYFNDIFKLI